jgi:hypothetical protein
MIRQNITLALPKDLLLKVKMIAVRRQVSVASLLASEIEKLLLREEAYDHACRRHLQVLEQGFDLGTGGRMTSTRDELHERR